MTPRQLEERNEKLRARVAELEAQLAMLQDEAAVRVNILRGTIKTPADLVWLGDTDGPAAKAIATAVAEEREAIAAMLETGRAYPSALEVAAAIRARGKS